VTEILTGEIVATWTPEQAAGHVIEAWQGAVESIIETGRRLIEAKDRIEHGGWLPTVGLLPFSEQTARKLMQIARHPDLSNRAHVRDLPASWGTLSVLAQLPPGEIPKRIEAHEITPELERATAQEWAATYSVAKQEALNAYGSAVDGLTAALSYAKTWTPPADITGGHLPVSEFTDRARELLEIAENWEQE
jgi:hypothetical protein